MTQFKNTSLILSLQDPELFPHKIEYFRVIETHISWVLLTGNYAYKIKKPLNLGFLDFSSLEKRRHFCLEEIRLNSRLAPDIYLDVVAISGTEQQPAFDDSCEAIEYAVKMCQFDADNTFDQLISQNHLSNRHIQETAIIIANFHNKIETAASNTEFGTPETIMQAIRENFSQIQQLTEIKNLQSLDHLALWSEQQYKMLLPLLKQRKQSGFIRECHGDLHLGNIALVEDRVVPFDGIEFNPSLYWIDVISEIAFLVMDLEDNNRRDLAFLFLNEYLQQSGDYAGLKLLRFYLLYRAMVRAKVNAIRASQSTSKVEHQQAINSYLGYLQLANRYTHSFIPQMIIMHGVSGSGKSWLSEQIINRHQAIRIRSDVERKRLQKLNPLQKSYSEINDDLYSQVKTDETYQQLLQLARDILNAGFNVIVDATFLQKRHRELFSLCANQLQVQFLIVHTKSNQKTLIERIKTRAGQRDNVSEADTSILENQLQHIQPLSEEELKTSISLETDLTSDLSKLWKYLDDNRHSYPSE